MAHLEPLPREALPEFRALFDQYEKIRGFVPNSILTMARRVAERAVGGTPGKHA